MAQIIAVVGMCGSGKSEVCRVLEGAGYSRIHFGAVTMEEVRKRGLEVNEKNEREVRESLRKEHGMAAYAILNLPKIEEAIKGSDVFIDGLYSWSEYKVLKEKFPSMKTLAVFTPRELRYKRLSERPERPLTREEIISRDHAEIENIEKGGPIAMADHTIINDLGLAELKEKVESVMEGMDDGR
ncbi:MAG: AAA family ATPase [Candidatus Woesearchaeota archaeon]